MVAKDMNIKKPEAIIDEVKAGVKKWKTFAKKAEVPAKAGGGDRKAALDQDSESRCSPYEP
jgi:hypothetical protein